MYGSYGKLLYENVIYCVGRVGRIALRFYDVESVIEASMQMKDLTYRTRDNLQSPVA